MRLRAGAATLAVAAALAAAGCGGSGSAPAASAGSTAGAGTVTTAAGRFCADLAALQRAASDFGDLDPANASVNELALAAANLGRAWQKVRASAASAGVDTTALTAAWRRVLAQAKGLAARSASPQAAVRAMKDAAAPLGREADALAPGCAGTPG